MNGCAEHEITYVREITVIRFHGIFVDVKHVSGSSHTVFVLFFCFSDAIAISDDEITG